jgi:hypothetical protein
MSSGTGGSDIQKTGGSILHAPRLFIANFAGKLFCLTFAGNAHERDMPIVFYLADYEVSDSGLTIQIACGEEAGSLLFQYSAASAQRARRTANFEE